MKELPTNLAGDWQRFAAAVEKRLRAGQRAYGDASLSAHPRALLDEVAEELEDVCGWSFMLWLRLRALRKRLPRTRSKRG